MRELYTQLDSLLDSIDYEKLWPGFHKFKFALYDEEQVFFKDEIIPCNNSFLGNTSIVYDGEPIAIWNIGMEKKLDIHLLAANLVHEMFHAFQLEKGEKRFPQDLVTLNYPVNIENLTLKHHENLVLVKAYEEKNCLNKSQLLKEIFSIRKQREGIIGEYTNCEYLTETAEGMAEYVGSLALKEISPEKFLHRMEEYVRLLSEPNEMLLNTRKLCYYSGTMLLMVLRDAKIDFFHDIGAQQETIFEMLSSRLNVKASCLKLHNDAIGAMASEYIKTIEADIEQFFSSPRKRIERNFYICGYDPMNMVKIYNRVLCNHFIMLMDEENEERIFLKGPLVIELVADTIDRVSAYYS